MKYYRSVFIYPAKPPQASEYLLEGVTADGLVLMWPKDQWKRTRVGVSLWDAQFPERFRHLSGFRLVAFNNIAGSVD